MHLAFICACLFSVAVSYPTGAPECDVEIVKQMSTSEDSTAHTITLNPTSYTAGQPVTVTFSGPVQFKGILIYAEDSTGAKQGSFVIPAGYQALSTNCITHTSADLKGPTVAFTWNAPSTSAGTLTLKAVVVRSFSSWTILDPVTLPAAATDVCGDSKRSGSEACDDGNTAAGDGCSATCTVESGFSCTGGSASTKDTCATVCGDGKRVGNEACDDGNTVAGDGCSDTCTVEAGFNCSGGSATAKDACTDGLCGDSQRSSHEGCDDGNTVNGDGCSSACVVETGFSCTGGDSTNKDTCSAVCGDSKHVGNEGCDDGNTAAGDGCSDTCTVEEGYSCSGGNASAKDTCTTVCGDGKRVGNEACDDGNTVAVDGCSQLCAIESGYNCTGGSASQKDTCTGAPTSAVAVTVSTTKPVTFAVPTTVPTAVDIPTLSTNTSASSISSMKVELPVGAVPSGVTLTFTPTISNDSVPTPSASTPRFLGVGFTLSRDSNSSTFFFSKPIYMSGIFSGNVTKPVELRLYTNSSGGVMTWMLAQETCPDADRLYTFNSSTKAFNVSVCHLTEFGFFESNVTDTTPDTSSSGNHNTTAADTNATASASTNTTISTDRNESHLAMTSSAVPTVMVNSLTFALLAVLVQLVGLTL